MTTRQARSATVPPAIFKLRYYKDLPIPFTTYIREGGVPDFKVTNERRRLACIKHCLCGICGTRLGTRIAFIGGPKSAASHTYYDPAMHEECARYAIATCPFLLGKDYVPEHKIPDDVEIVEAVSPQTPDAIVLYITTGYRISGQLITADLPLLLETFERTVKEVKN